MKRRNVASLLVLFVSLFLSTTAYANSYDGEWGNSAAWYQTGEKVRDDKVDVFYLVSTDVLSAKDSLGRKSYLASLIPEDTANMNSEFSYIKRRISQSDFNFFAPYYHQFTFEAISLPTDTFTIVYKSVAKEVCEAFDYYMKYQNKGRRFILAGFSQGAMLTLDLLKHLTDEQYSRMVAAYVIGYRLSAEDLRHPHIKAAKNETDGRSVVSFNSALSNTGIWNFVAQGAATCINPLNWRTDTTPAVLINKGDTGTVRIDSVTHILIVNMKDNARYRKYMDESAIYSSVNHDNLHHWEILFYADALHRNMVKRAYE